MNEIKELIKVELNNERVSECIGAPVSIQLGITEKNLRRISHNLDDEFLDTIDKRIETANDKELLLRIEFHLHSIGETRRTNGETNKVTITPFEILTERNITLNDKKINIEFGIVEIKPVE